jgi:hypothetical protein
MNGVPPIVHDVLRSPGQPLDAGAREFMEPRFGHDFSRVRVHTDARAAESARAVNAHAYTVGQDIVFGSGQYAPDTTAGQRLLTHELTHTLQQDGGPEPAPGPDSSAEREADRASHAIVAGSVLPQPQLHTGPGLARQVRTRNLAELPDAELQVEHARIREWLMKHSMVEVDYPATSEYFQKIEDEVRRRSSGGGGKQGRPPLPATATGGPPTIPPPVSLSGEFTPGLTSRPAPMTAAHAGGALGEREVAFALGERGFRFAVSPTGPGAHRLTGSGFDSVAYNPANGEIWLIDNKATGSVGNIEGKKATALGRNLEASLNGAVQAVRNMPDFPDRPVILDRLERAHAAVRNGQPIPANLNVKLKVTNAGGYATGARNLPRGVDFEDVVGPGAAAARRADVAQAEQQGIAAGRPRSHAQTEAMRQRVGGVQTREPVRTSVGRQVAITIRTVGGRIVGIGITIIWNYGMSRVERWIESKVTQDLFEEKMKPLEPIIASRLNDQVRAIAELQLRNPGKPVYGNISILATMHRYPGEDEELIGLDVELTGVAVSTEKIERSEHSRVWVGSYLTARAPNDIIRTTYSVELEPLSKDQLRAILAERIAEEEFAVGESSTPAEALLASQRRHDELVSRLKELGPTE